MTQPLDRPPLNIREQQRASRGHESGDMQVTPATESSRERITDSEIYASVTRFDKELKRQGKLAGVAG